MKSRMSSWENDEIALTREAARRFFEKEFAPQLDRWIEQRMVDREAWTAAGEAGLLYTSIPDQYGGAGAT